ncbi:hypothetical protein G6F46_003292 [Rhizopus delemar]|uniref:Protein kinase domain-containing protein n=2 Tax=Rhizopus TaxID=4842 RepID=A0A9P6YW07_9FUNG|nr:hypothetical protein G6F55_009813 [Rhizopus delemar]KAG1536909.1 hypothetical protein G6F51_010690 [Rhizopus arrhizus]KAG1491208.1 hypothetical protein G6F54_010184 [Rhizopus delemar]KAG1518413.1 hypothetical protein G6F53_000601 [Rhizopus delemar]KAG1520283.1 hypothetical protein G6F52_007811 [Rhizopus delemar]
MGQFENAAEYLLAPDRCMMCRVETGHFLVYTFEEDRIDLLASPALYGREEGNRAEGEDLDRGFEVRGELVPTGGSRCVGCDASHGQDGVLERGAGCRDRACAGTASAPAEDQQGALQDQAHGLSAGRRDPGERDDDARPDRGLSGGGMLSRASDPGRPASRRAARPEADSAGDRLDLLPHGRGVSRRTARRFGGPSPASTASAYLMALNTTLQSKVARCSLGRPWHELMTEPSARDHRQTAHDQGLSPDPGCVRWRPIEQGRDEDEQMGNILDDPQPEDPSLVSPTSPFGGSKVAGSAQAPLDRLTWPSTLDTAVKEIRCSDSSQLKWTDFGAAKILAKRTKDDADEREQFGGYIDVSEKAFVFCWQASKVMTGRKGSMDLLVAVSFRWATGRRPWSTRVVSDVSCHHQTPPTARQRSTLSRLGIDFLRTCFVRDREPKSD